MADSRQLDTAVVSSVWRSGSSPLRSAVTLAVGQVRAADMAPALRELLSDSDTAVAASAAYSLGLLRDSGAVSALAATLGAPSAVAREAAWALGEIGAPAASAVQASLAAGARPNEVLGDLLLASAKLRPVPAETVIPYLQHPDSEVRWRAAYAVARPLVPAGLRALLSLVGDTSAAVRAQVARAFSVRAAGDSLRRNALDVLARLVQDPHPHVRINAIRSLSTYGPGARTAVAGAVRDPDANVRITAAQSLGAVMDSSAAPWLILWNADTGFMYRRSLLASAIRSGARLPWHEATAAESWTRSGDWRLRAAVAEAAGSATDEATLLGIAQPLTRDPDGRVRTAAYSSLSPDTSRTSAIQTERRALILSALGDPDFYARATAIAALLPRASAAEVPAVVASYRMALGDSLFDARIAAVRYVAAAWRQDSQAFTDSLRLELTALAIPSEALVRGEGKSVSPLRHWAAETGTARPIVWYEDRVRALVLPALRGRVPRAEIVTERGTIMLDLFALDAPLTVDNFVRLARGGYYDGVRFHRVVPNFVAQDGDPRGDGNGGPPHTIRDELNRRRYTRGAVGMALSGPDTGGSQYFITLSPQPHLDGGYTVFGGVVSGQHVMDALVQGDLIRTIRIR